MARPRKEINVKLLERLAMIQCTVEEMAACLNVSKDTLERRFAAVIEKGKESGRSSIRRQQYKMLMAGNATMAVWLGKQYLGQRDKHEQTGPDGGPIDVRVLTDDQRAARAAELIARARERANGHDAADV